MACEKPPAYDDCVKEKLRLAESDCDVECRSTKCEDDDTKREVWSGKLEFILSCLSYAVGLGNLWRFPYLCYQNGGGAFLIPYVVMMIFAGIPLFFMELSFGQYGRTGLVGVWDACPLFRGLGWGMFLVSCIVALYYNIIVSWSFLYLFSSFTGSLPWTTCNEDWSSSYCTYYVQGLNSTCASNGGIYLYGNQSCVNTTGLDNYTISGLQALAANTTPSLRHPSDDYFHYGVLDISEGLHDIGQIKWKLALCLLLAWALIVVLLSKGVQSMGKASYFTAFFPYLVLVILLVRGLTLEGSTQGILFYITPDFERLKTAKVWGDAAVQIFFSLGPCWGGLVTLGSYNKFHNNCLRDTIIVCLGNCATSVFAGFVIFSIIGFMAHELGVPVGEVVRQGPGVAFIAYPQAVTKLPISPMWSIMFFLMLLTLGFGTQFTVVTTVHTTVIDFWPRLRRPLYKVLSLAVIAMFFFLLGLVFVSQGGMYVFQLVDNYGASYSVLFLGFTECVAIAYVYGIKRFYRSIEKMLKKKLNIWWKIMWCGVTPGIILFIIVFKIIDFKPSSYNGYVYPAWADAIGWCISILAYMPVPVCAVIAIVTEYKKNKQRTIREIMRVVTSPVPGYGDDSEDDEDKSEVSEDSQEMETLSTSPSRNSSRTPFISAEKSGAYSEKGQYIRSSEPMLKNGKA